MRVSNLGRPWHAGGGDVMLWKMFSWETRALLQTMETAVPGGCGLSQHDNVGYSSTNQTGIKEDIQEFDMLTQPPDSPDQSI